MILRFKELISSFVTYDFLRQFGTASLSSSLTDRKCSHSRRLTRIRLLLVLLIIAVSAVNVMRSVRQSLSIDEAMTYLSFVSKPLAEMFVYYDANNHVLFTLLSRVCYLALGDAEWAIRLPSVLAGFAFMILLAKLLFQLLGESWSAVLAWLGMMSNPLLLDHLVVGRGYGLALALWMGALLVLVDGGVDCGRRRWVAAGTLLGLSIAANLILLIPGTGLGVAYLLLRGRWGAGLRAGVWIAGTTVLVAGAILYPALRHASADHFYFGAESWSQTLDQYVWMTAIPSGGSWDLNVILTWQKRLLLFALGLTVVAIPWLLRRGQALFIALPILFTFGLTEAANRMAGVKYPLDRTSLPLFVVSSLAMAAVATLSQVRYAVILVFVLLAGSHFGAARWSYFGEWPWDSDNRELAVLAATKEGKICATWVLVPSLNYYRQRLGLRAPELVRDEKGPSCVWYFAAPDDRDWPAVNGFLEVKAGRQSKVTVYRKASR